MKKLEKYLLACVAGMFIFILGAVVGNGNALVQSQPYRVHNSSNALGLCPAVINAAVVNENRLIAMHNAGIAVFDVTTIADLEKQGKLPVEKHTRVMKKQRTSKKHVATDDYTDIDQAFVRIVDPLFYGKQLWVSDNADTVFTSAEDFPAWRLADLVALKKHYPGKKEIVFAEATGTFYHSTIEDSSLFGKSRAELFRLFSENTIPVSNQKEHLFYCDTTGVGIYGQIFDNGDTVILRIDSMHIADGNSAVADTGTTNNILVPESIRTVDQSHQSDVQVSNQTQVVNDEVNITENQSEITHPKLEKKKQPRDNHIVKHDHHKLKKNKNKEKKKKKNDKSSIEVHF